MKKLVFTFIVVMTYSLIYSQDNPDCSFNFLSLKTNGVIQQWSLENGMVVKKDSLLSENSGGIAYCNFQDTPTYYTTNHPETGVTYYVNNSMTWMTIPTSVPVLNNGGYNNDQYFMSPIGGNKILYYFDGLSFTTIDSLSASEVFTIADIAVDTLGQAWVFKGTAQNKTTNLNVYNRNGLLKSYDLTLTAHGLYGSFFLNETLYLGSSQFSPLNNNSITPLLIDGDNVSFGEPISFPYDSYTDLASCQIRKTVSTVEITDTETYLYPNPTDGLLYLSNEKNILNIRVFDLAGSLVFERNSTNDLDLSSLENGCYLVKVETPVGVILERIIKI